MKGASFHCRRGKRAALAVALLLLVTSALHAAPCSPTQPDVEGPFYLPDTPFRSEIARQGAEGVRIGIGGRILADDCKTPLEGVLVEVWQTDAGGNYKGRDEGVLFRGKVTSAKDGSYRFATIMPGRYRLGKSYRPAHIHFRVSRPGYDTLVTQLYFKGDPYLAPKDPCGVVCRSGDPARIIGMDGVGKGIFDIILARSGDNRR